MTTIKNNLEKINGRIYRAARKVGREPEEIRLVAVSKRVPIDLINEACIHGQKLFGENYPQEAVDKISRMESEIKWHFIGHLQSNKASMVAGAFDVVETVDRLKIAMGLNKFMQENGKILPVLVQVNIGRETQKSGVLPEEAWELSQELLKLKNLQVRGLMVMPPFLPDPEAVRPFFKQTRGLALTLQDMGVFGDRSPELSMGMSGDYEVAIEEGATLVRVGTALFGRR